MRRQLVRCAFVVLVAAAALLPAGGAWGKGASSIQIRGPGLARALTVSGRVRYGPEPLMPLMVVSGFWYQLCDSCRNHVMHDPPAGDLGPRYTITYRMELGQPVHEVVQYVFPFAKPRPVTYMPTSQIYFGHRRSGGGWYVAKPGLMPILVGFGLPATAPVPSVAPAQPGPAAATPMGSSAAWLTLVAVVLAALAAASLLVLSRSRRAKASTTVPSRELSGRQEERAASV